MIQQLSEIQEIMYSDDKDRTSAIILRFHNLTFQHAVLMNALFVGNSKSLTQRKMSGQYYHALVSHAPIQLGIMSLASANSENEERGFNFFKEISTHASNHHPENVLLNAFLRIQVRTDWEKHIGKKIKITQNEISNHSKFLSKFRQFFSFELLTKAPRQWQSHLERICDFLSLDSVWEEQDNGILIHDLENVDIPTHHFRSSSLQIERE